MNSPRDIADQLADTVRAAAAHGSALHIRGGGTKSFLDNTAHDGRDTMDVTAHRGIVSYEPSELVITARCGTPLSGIREALASEGQVLPFDPPAFGPGATLGGVVSAGLSGPGRPYTGSVRDSVLGVRLLTGRGHCLRFGGEVMKNVAGYDISRLIAGAWGTLGVLLEVSVRVLPVATHARTVRQTVSTQQALSLLGAWTRQPLPVTAACFVNGTLYVRLSGGPGALDEAVGIVGGEALEDDQGFWSSVREQTHGFFQTTRPLWRLSVPPATKPMDLPGDWLLDWGGAQRWLISDAPPEQIRASAEKAGGHALLFRNPMPGVPRAHPLPETLRKLEARLRLAMDPHSLFNPGHSMVSFGGI